MLGACGGGGGALTTTSTTAAPTTSQPAPSARPIVLEPSAGVVRAETAGDAPIDYLVGGLNNAGFRLWRSQPAEDNFVFSPISVGHAVLMARAAADQATGEAIDAAFGLPPGRSAHQAWNAVDLMMAGDVAEKDITVRIADRIWPRVGLQPDQAWIDLLAAEHGVTTETLDFGGDPEGSREVINQWVSEETEGLIPELIPKGFIEPRTVLVLTDAIYFKAQWQKIFGKYGPITDVFTRLDGTTVTVDFMQELELGDLRGEGDGFVGAEIPYLGGNFSMLVIVPDEGRFTEIRDGLDQAMLAEIDATFTTGPYELILPPWDDKANLDLLPWLVEIGVAPGSYPGIHPAAFLGAAVHATDITVDEWGTVAAAATGLGFLLSGPPEPELTVAADKPFLYLIRHRPTGMVLFAGQVTDPIS